MVGIVHAVAHSVGGVAGVPHGLANSIILPHGMEFNLDFCADKYALSAYSMGVAPSGDEKADAAAGIAKVRELVSKIGLPTKLSEVGVTEDQLEEIALTTMGDGSLFTNPRSVEEHTEVLELLKKAF
jgi:alcohol dehydrogenase class IV